MKQSCFSFEKISKQENECCINTVGIDLFDCLCEEFCHFLECFPVKNNSSFQEFFIISHSRLLFSFQSKSEYPQSMNLAFFVVDLPRAGDLALSTDKAGSYQNFTPKIYCLMLGMPSINAIIFHCIHESQQ